MAFCCVKSENKFENKLKFQFCEKKNVASNNKSENTVANLSAIGFDNQRAFPAAQSTYFSHKT